MLPKALRILKENEFHPVQLRVFFVMVTLYTFYFTCNNNLGVAASEIQRTFALNNVEFGVLFTIFTLGFGLGQFFSGYLGDRYSPKMLMLVGAIGAACANIGFGLSSNMTAFCVLWAVNAVCLAMGWSPGCSILFRWIPKKRWGLFMGVFDAFAFLGGILIYPIAGFALSYLSWRAAFFLPASMLLLWTAAFVLWVKDSPQQCGFDVEWKEEISKETITLKDYGTVMKNGTILLVSLSTICSQFVRWGLVNWMVKILAAPVEGGGFGMALMAATVIASAMHWGGAVFSIFFGYLSDRAFRGSRWQTIVIGFTISGISLLLIHFCGLWLMDLKGGIIALGALLFLAGGCVQGVQAPQFNLPGDILGTRLGGTGVGIVNGWSYMGASFAGVSLGFVMDHLGLLSCLVLMAVISFLGAVAILFVRQ